MPSNLLIKPDTRADIPASSGTLGLGAESGKTKAPLQSQSYIKGGSSIRVCLITTLNASEQLTLSVEEYPVSLARVTTLRTLLRSLCSGNFNNINPILPCNGLNSNPELVEWNAMDLPVGSLRLYPLAIPLSQVFEFLNGNYSIVFHCNLNDFMAYLPDSRVDEVSLIMLHLPQGSPSLTASFICITSKLTPSIHKLPLLVPYILPQIQLLSNLLTTIQNRQSKATTVNINPYNSLIVLFNLKLLSEIDDDNIMSILLVQSELSTSPAIIDVFNKSLISTILLYRQCNSAIPIKRRNYDNRIPTLCFSKLSRARDVKPDRDLVELFAAQVLPNLVDAINEDLGMQVVFLFNNRIGGGM